jgi:hypothetical protein
MMDYQHAMNILQAARVYRPAVVSLGDAFHVFSRTELLGSGATIEAAMRASGHYPAKPRTDLEPFAAVGTSVMQGTTSICVARSYNSAMRIANALNEYIPSKRGF